MAEAKDISRDKVIIRTSVIGIVANAFLAGFKAVIGLLSNSIAIVLDAVNNLSDAASSIITIVGTKLAGKPADRKHPFGHGRVEYLTALVISVIVLYAGVTSFTESIKKIITPKTPDYSAASMVIIGAAVLVKIVLGRYVKGVGEKVNSDSLINSGTDAMLDSVISASTLAAAIIYITTDISLEAWLGAVISLVIIKSGIDMLRETISQLLGERVDADLARAIKKTVNGFPDVLGVYDLILHNYGPDNYSGSLHIEIPDTYSADRIDVLNRAISMAVFREHGVILTAIGVYSMNTKSELAKKVKDDVAKIVFSHENVLQLHGFHLDEEIKNIRFDIIISFDEPDREALYEHIRSDINEAYPDYTLEMVLDTDFTES
ncbi:MAG: cation transporter [Ruminococcus sp.]|nr:cation transporter [Ruminococcus sp.]